MKLNTSATNFQLPPEGTHAATFTGFEDLKERPHPFQPGKMQHQVKLTFSIPCDAGLLKQHTWMTASLNENAWLFKVVRALLGKKPNGVVDLNDLIGRSCLIEIEHYNSNGKQRSKIVDYSPAPTLHGVSVSDDDLADFGGEDH
jgi:hypothetical protein